MDAKSIKDQTVDIDFESHPPIDDDLDGIAALLRQSLLNFVDCTALAKYLISLKDTTQIIAQDSADEAATSEGGDADEEADDDIYGVISAIELPTRGTSSQQQDELVDARKKLLKFLKDKCSKLKESLTKGTGGEKYCLVINERYINLPPQLALPTFKTLTQALDESKFTSLIFVSKILVRSRSSETDLPSKKAKSTSSSSAVKGQDEPLVYVNPEEEIIFEKCDFYSDFDVSAHCDENATWSFSSDVKYIPHRRICVVNYKEWPEILKCLEEELK